MPLPSQTFPDFPSLLAYINANIKPNGNEEITGILHNNVENGLLTFIEQSPLNWEKADVVNSASAQVAQRPVVVFTGSTPASITWVDNIYNEYVFINMTVLPIPILGSLGYYNLSGQFIQEIPANTAINIFKASNDLWVQGNNSSTGGGGSVQRQPNTYIVGTTPGAPTAGTNTWTLPVFLNAYVVLIVNRVPIDLIDSGDGSPFITKPLISATLTIGNYSTGWNNGDILTYILITP